MGLFADIYNVIIIGGGPAGLAPLLAAHRTGKLNTLLASGVAIVEKSAYLGSGSIGRYDINSDSSGRTFVDCLQSDNGTETELTCLANHPSAERLRSVGDGAVPLQDVGRFLRLVGDAIGRMIRQHSLSQVITQHSAICVKQVPLGWQVHIRDLQTGENKTLLARHVVIATGGHQPIERLVTEKVGTINLLEHCAGRLVQSGEVLEAGGLARIADRLAGRTSPRVAIVGGSTSAASVAHTLLHRLPSIQFGHGGITLMHRRELRIFYPDRASALAENYTEWTEDDVCQISGRVFRFAGFRLDARELMMQARGIGGRKPEPRFKLHRLGVDDLETRNILDRVDLVIAALGYRPRALPVYDSNDSEIIIQAQMGPQMAMVDDQCRILDASGSPITGLFGIGLAAGFVPRGALGGELSFRGQANGLWLWQHDVGALIVEAVVKSGRININLVKEDFPAETAWENLNAHTMFS